MTLTKHGETHTKGNWEIGGEHLEERGAREKDEVRKAVKDWHD